MKISVIIPAYEAHEFIEQCLDSIVEQTYFKNNDYEILLGIDGCEKTLQKVEQIKYKYPKLRVLWCKENKGCYIMTNTLIQQVKYDYIQKFDSDDWMKKDMVEEMVRGMEKNDVVAVFPFSFAWRRGKVIGTLPACNMPLIKKLMYNKLGGYCAWECSADSEFGFRLKRNFTTKQLKQPLFYRRKHPNSLTAKFRKNSPKRKGYRDIIEQMSKDKVVYVEPVTNQFQELWV